MSQIRNISDHCSTDLCERNLFQNFSHTFKNAPIAYAYKSGYKGTHTRIQLWVCVSVVHVTGYGITQCLRTGPLAGVRRTRVYTRTYTYMNLCINWYTCVQTPLALATAAAKHVPKPKRNRAYTKRNGKQNNAARQQQFCVASWQPKMTL